MIVHIISGLGRGGAEQALYRLLSQEDQPSQTRVVSLTDGGIFQQRMEVLGIKVTCLHMRQGPAAILIWWRLVRLLREWKPSIVQTWMYHADLLGGLAARMAGVPVCWGIRNSDLSSEESKVSTRMVAKACAHLSTFIPARAISCSARAVDVHRSLGYSLPFAVVPNGVDVRDWTPRPSMREPMRERLGIPSSAVVFAHAGRADPQKDHATLMRAFAQVQTEYPDCYLLLCGHGLLPGLAYFERLPVSPDGRKFVRALGPRDDLADLWQAADVFVLSSAYGEAFPNVVVEAMACGLPAVVTDVGDSAEIVCDTGRVVPPSDTKALATAMSEMIDVGIDARRRLGQAARERVQSDYTLARMSAGFRRVWDEVLRKD